MLQYFNPDIDYCSDYFKVIDQYIGTVLVTDVSFISDFFSVCSDYFLFYSLVSEK